MPIKINIVRRQPIQSVTRTKRIINEEQLTQHEHEVELRQEKLSCEPFAHLAC